MYNKTNLRAILILRGLHYHNITREQKETLLKALYDAELTPEDNVLLVGLQMWFRGLGTPNHVVEIVEMARKIEEDRARCDHCNNREFEAKLQDREPWYCQNCLDLFEEMAEPAPL